MNKIDNILVRLEKIIKEGEWLRNSQTYWDFHQLNEQSLSLCIWWLGSVNNFLRQYLKESNWYFNASFSIINETHSRLSAHKNVWKIVEILKQLDFDIRNWFLKWFESQISAEIFDTFLDHWEWYLKNKMKNEAWVIIGVTFEDTVRKLARLNAIEENGVKLDEIISRLQSSDIFTPIEAKRARSCAAVRTSAAHAKWDEFKENDVEATLVFTRELISKVDSTL
jgi:hypothetical protein